jgi:hypothetical protein
VWEMDDFELMRAEGVAGRWVASVGNQSKDGYARPVG